MKFTAHGTHSLDTYSHVFGTMRRAAADAMDRSVGGQN
jgi:hypothetical protein